MTTKTWTMKFMTWDGAVVHGEKHEYFSTPVRWTSLLLQLSVAVNKKMYFKEFHDLLILFYGDNIVSDEEFLLLYNTFKTKNPEFPHRNYKQFYLDSMNSAKCRAEFRVEKQDLPHLVAALQLPPVLRCEQRSICEDIEGLCMLLKRVAYPFGLSDMFPRFGQPVAVISLITNDVIDYIYDIHGTL